MCSMQYKEIDVFLGNYYISFLLTMTLSLYFSVVCPNTQLGEEVYIIGSISELGNWTQGVKLQTDPNLYPQWKNQNPIDVDPQVKIEFKACIKDSNGRIVKWEEIEGDRSFVPTASMQIIFRFSNPHVDYVIQHTEVEERLPFRKVTMDNVEELSDCKSVSSGWDQFGKNISFKDEASVQTDLMNQAKYLYQNWRPDKVGIFKTQKQLNQCHKTNHVVISRKNMNTIQGETASKCMIEYVNSQDLSEILEAQNPLQLFFFYFQLNEAEKQAILNIQTSHLGFLIFQVSVLIEQNQLFEKIAKKAHLLVVNDYQILVKITEIYESLNYKILMQSQNCMKVWLDLVSLTIFYYPSGASHCKMEQMLGNSEKYEQKIQELIMKNGVKMPTRYQIKKILSLNKSDFSTIQGGFKFCILVHCQKLSDFSVQITTLYQKLALRSNVEIYIIVDQKPPKNQVQKIMPLHAEKLVIVDLSGQIHSSKSSHNLYKQLNVQLTGMQSFCKIVEQKIRQLLPDSQVIIQCKESTMKIKSKLCTLTKIFVDWLEKEVIKLSLNCKNRFPIEVTRSQLRQDRQKYECIELKSVLNSLSFYYHFILAAIEHSNLRFQIFIYSFDFRTDQRVNEGLIGNGQGMNIEKFIVDSGERKSQKRLNSGVQEGIAEKEMVTILQKIHKMSLWVKKQSQFADLKHPSKKMTQTF